MLMQTAELITRKASAADVAFIADILDKAKSFSLKTDEDIQQVKEAAYNLSLGNHTSIIYSTLMWLLFNWFMLIYFSISETLSKLLISCWMWVRKLSTLHRSRPTPPPGKHIALRFCFAILCENCFMRFKVVVMTYLEDLIFQYSYTY